LIAGGWNCNLVILTDYHSLMLNSSVTTIVITKSLSFL
jgi:hypothetical protein